MLAGLLLMRADRRAYFRWPVYSAMAMVLGVVSWNLLRRHVLPAEWVITRANALYFGALGLYSLTGFGARTLAWPLTGVKRRVRNIRK